MSDERRELLDALQQRLGYRFGDIALLERALTHRSYAHERQRWDEHGVLEDNERLEFLGDGVLHLVVAEYLYEAHPSDSEGELHRRRRRLVQNTALTQRGRELALDDPRLLLRGRIPENEARRGEARRLEDAVEAVVGAIFLDAGFERTRAVLLSWLRAGDVDLHGGLDPKSRLQEAIQARGLPIPRYALVDAGGPDHERWFESVVNVETEPDAAPVEWGRGRATSKRKAEIAAAVDAWARLIQAGLVEADPVE